VTPWLAKEHRTLLVASLVEEAENGTLTPERIQDAARQAGVHTRTIRRWISARKPPAYERPRYEATDRDRDAYWEANGIYPRAWEIRRKEDPELPSLSTWTRALKRGTSKDERTHAKGGQRGRAGCSVYLPVEAPCRNAVWEGDHKLLDAWVLPMRGTKPQRPWMTTFLDSATRAVMGFSLSVHANTTGIIEALHAAVDRDPQLGPFRGVPERVHFDNGRDWLSEGFEQVLDMLGSVPVPLDPYAPHKKGKIERFHRTLVETFLSQQPFYTAGPRSASGKHYWPTCDPPLITEFFDQLHAWIARYNRERPHSSLGDQSPLAIWNADPAPLRERSSGQLAMLLPHTNRKVLADGIHFEGLRFFADEFHALRGEQVQIRYRPHDLRSIHVFFEGRYACEAKPVDLLTKEERDRFLAARRAHRRRASNLRRRATAKAGARLAPLTKRGQAAVDPRAITKRDRRNAREQANRAPRLPAEARRLLGLD
jgi:putative transposase